MLITLEQQTALINNYSKEGHTTDECIGFIDGIIETMNLIEKLNKNQSL